MNDYWNDPPEENDWPECCDEFMTIDEKTGIAKYETCGKEIKPQKDEAPNIFEFSQLPTCVHTPKGTTGGRHDLP